MSILLIAIGVIMAAGGAVTIGFGVPINAFSLGNTLIIAGTVALAGGFVIIALGGVLAQLRRIRETLQFSRPPSVAAPMEAAVDAPPVRFDPRPEPLENLARDTTGADDLTEPLDGRERNADRFGLDQPARRARRDFNGPSLRAPSPSPLSTMAEPPALDRGSRLRADPEGETESRIDHRARPAQTGFGASLRPRTSLRTDRADTTDLTAAKTSPAKRDFDVGETSRRTPVEPPIAPPPAETETSAPVLDEQRAAVIKSGVIEGMAYTLYADGSIEAELAQGKVHFASLDALRQHIESTG